MSFVDIPKEIVEKADEFDKQVFEFKKSYKVQNRLNSRSHFYSKLTEWAFANRFGLEDQLDWTLHHQGDLYDFKVGDLTIDIKSTTYWRYPEIKCYPDEGKCDIYVLAAVIPELFKVRLVGWIEHELLFSPTNYKSYRNLGMRYFVTESQLHKDWEWLREKQKQKQSQKNLSSNMPQ